MNLNDLILPPEEANEGFIPFNEINLTNEHPINQNIDENDNEVNENNYTNNNEIKRRTRQNQSLLPSKTVIASIEAFAKRQTEDKNLEILKFMEEVDEISVKLQLILSKCPINNFYNLFNSKNNLLFLLSRFELINSIYLKNSKSVDFAPKLKNDNFTEIADEGIKINELSSIAGDVLKSNILKKYKQQLDLLIRKIKPKRTFNTKDECLKILWIYYFIYENGIVFKLKREGKIRRQLHRNDSGLLMTDDDENNDVYTKGVCFNCNKLLFKIKVISKVNEFIEFNEYSIISLITRHNCQLFTEEELTNSKIVSNIKENKFFKSNYLIHKLSKDYDFEKLINTTIKTLKEENNYTNHKILEYDLNRYLWKLKHVLQAGRLLLRDLTNNLFEIMKSIDLNTSSTDLNELITFIFGYEDKLVIKILDKMGIESKLNLKQQMKFSVKRSIGRNSNYEGT